MTQAVSIACAARLHLGFLDLNFGLGRRFGSLGLALEAPQTRLALRRAAAACVTGPEAARAGRYLDAITAALGLAGDYALRIETAMPAHAGLGSGTQLALAVATAVRRLEGLAPDLSGDAVRLGRGARSGIGMALFASGGLVLDGGRGTAATPPPLLARLAVPPAWRVLLLLDPARAGLSGGAERDAFAALAPMPAASVERLCRLVLLQLLPALAEADFAGFGAAVTRLQGTVGDYFAPAQGGRFLSPLVGAALARLTAWGAQGIGQSSWGPTGFAFAPDPAAAEWLRARLAAADLREGGGAPEVLICRARNCGAEIAELG